MADNVQVDGVKPLDEEERQKSRAIVLETIGEKESPPPERKEPSTINKRLDGILGFGFGKKREVVEPERKEPAIIQEHKIAWQNEIKKMIPATPAADFKKEEADIKAPAKNIILADVKPQPEIKKVDEPPAEKKVTPPPPKKTEKISEAKEAKNKLRKIFRKKQKTAAKYSHFPASKLSLSVRHRTARQPRFKGLLSFSQNWHENSKHFEEKINIIVRRSVCWLGIFLGATIAIYFLLVVSIIKTNADNKILRSLDRYLVIPALIAPDGVIDYFQYQDIKNQLHSDGAGVKKFIIQRLIISDLYRRLRINTNRSIDDLEQAIINDEEINNVSLERIRKIYELIKRGNDFTAVAAKYGDESGQLDLTAANRTQYSFGEQIASLGVGEVSGVISSATGYYIFKTTNQGDTDQRLSYVFIRSKSLSKYLIEATDDYKLISFVD